MKQGKNFIKTNIKTKAIILFWVFALFCIFGILACGGESLPTNSAGDRLNDSNIINNNNNTNSVKTNLTTNLPTFDKNFTVTNVKPSTPNPAPEPEPKPDTNPSLTFPSDSYLKIVYHVGDGKIDS